MIGFIRKLRKRFAQDDALGKYLLYAFGELLLVVLGILIALYINNWSESEKMRRTNTTLLRQLRDENRLNMADLEDDVAYRDTLDVMLFDFHRFLKKGNLKLQEAKLRGYLEATLRTSLYTPANENLNKYLTTNLNDNSSLVTELVVLNSYQQALQDVCNRVLQFKLDRFYQFLSSDVDLYSLEIETFEKLQSLEFRNNIVLLESLEESVFTSFENTYLQQKRIDSLISLTLE